ncbi:MAG: hypothetical protein AAGF24_03470 [Cyanobacteria bacterium P01_H01_bin.121]
MSKNAWSLNAWSPSTWSPAVAIACYCLSIVGAIALALMIKWLAVRVADQLLYPLPLVGGILRHLELLELLNILVFAILGTVIGLSTGLLASAWGSRVSRLLLIILIPCIFLSGSLFEYRRWLTDIAESGALSVEQAAVLSDQWLKRTVNRQGFLGFYSYTAAHTRLPLQETDLRQMQQSSAQASTMFARLIPVDWLSVNGILAASTWGLRLFYLILASLVATSHFQQGLRNNRLKKPVKRFSELT